MDIDINLNGISLLGQRAKSRKGKRTLKNKNSRDLKG